MNAHSSTKKLQRPWLWLSPVALLALAAALPILGQQEHKRSPTPPGLYITPTASDHAVQQVLNPGLANYPNFVPGEAVKAVVSPDGNTLAILTAGMNSLYFPNFGEASTNPNIGQVDQSASTQFLFLYDIAGTNRKKGTTRVLKQVIQQLNAHVGLVWAPNSQTIYAAGGCDDVVYVYTNNGGTFALSSQIPLGHAPNGCVSNAANRTGLGIGVEPNVAGLAISADGTTLVAANNYNDSISVIDTATGKVQYEYDLRPFFTSGAPAGTKGGTFPFAVVLNGNVAYVGADRDREVVAVNIAGSGSLVARIELDGNPNGMALSADGSASLLRGIIRTRLLSLTQQLIRSSTKSTHADPPVLIFPRTQQAQRRPPLLLIAPRTRSMRSMRVRTQSQ